MLTSLQNNIIFILFEFVFFAILVVQLYQIVKEYILPFLREQIMLLAKQWNDLQNKLKLTLQTKKRLQTNLKEQTAALNSLEEKVEDWHTALLEKQKKTNQKQIEITHALTEKKKRQLAYQTRLYAKKAVIPTAIANAEKTLLQTCAGEKGKAFLANVVTQLGKES